MDLLMLHFFLFILDPLLVVAHWGGTPHQPNPEEKLFKYNACAYLTLCFKSVNDNCTNYLFYI